MLSTTPPDFGHGRPAIAACNTVRGAGDDVKSAANCTENAIHGGNC
jgi:hypothetical protein